MNEGPRGWATPLYDRVLDVATIGVGTSVLDVGCGGGGFSAAAVARGARVQGVDSDPSAVRFATAQVPGATFAVGDAHDLGGLGPFDVAAAVQLLAHVTNPVLVLREAARVAPTVVVTVWGSEEECDVRAFGEALSPWLGTRRPPPGPPAVEAPAGPPAVEAPAGPPAVEAPAGPPPVTAPERLRHIVETAGLQVTALEEIVCPFVYEDEDELVAPLFDSGIGRHAMNAAGPAAVRAAVLTRLAPNRAADGSYALNNTFRILTARAPG